MFPAFPCNVFVLQDGYINPVLTDQNSVLRVRMLRPVYLALFLLMAVLMVVAEGQLDQLDPARQEVEPSPNNANDLEADASAWGYSRPWRYGWRSGGWGGWRGGGWGWGGRVWTGRGGWW